MTTKTIKTPLMMAEEKRKRNTVVCPKCGQRTTFNLIMDAIDEDVIATSIKSVQPAVISNDALFDLQGRRIAKPGKGLYIKNGRTVLIK